MQIDSVKINGLDNPLGFALNPLICSWKVRDSKGKNQIWAKIRISLNPDVSDSLWEKEGELNSLGEKIDLALTPYTRYYYQVTVKSDAGEIAESSVHYFETAKLDEAWRGQWIGVQKEDSHPEFHCTFVADKPLRRARLYICGLGLFEAYINGQKAGEDLLAPFINDYEEHYQYCSYDITGLIQRNNEMSVLLGDGWYRGRFGLEGTAKPHRPLALIAELHLWYQDGTHTCIATDESWEYRTSFTKLSDIYDGEIQDYLEPAGVWKAAVPKEAPGKLCHRYSPALHYQETLPVKQVIHTPAGETVLDFGQNFAGHVICTQHIPVGTVMKLEFGEILQDGNFYHDNYRTAKSQFVYRSDGIAREIRPRFTFFGFRYVKVSGLQEVDPACFTGRAIYSQMEQTGFLHTGNMKINQLISNSIWGLKSNFLDMPTDCPQRDERLGWTGDAQVFCTTAGFHMDTRAFYHKYLRDLRTDQIRHNGAVAHYLPFDRCMDPAGVWGDAAAFIPKMLYDYYGCREMLEIHYPLMRDWVDWVYRKDLTRGKKNLYDFGFQYGDWLALDGATEQSAFGRTDSGFICSLYYLASTSYVADAARILGKPEASVYRERVEAIRSAILEEYVTPSGRLAVDTQTGYLAALKFGVYRDKQKLIDGFMNRFKQDGRKLTGGFVGATMMNCVLAEQGLTDLAYDILFYEGFPGWLYAVNLGATTIWERWNSVLPDGTISGTGMNSLNHYAYGSVVEFLYRYSAGITPLEPGFRKARIAPVPEIRLGKVSCRFDSVSGQYACSWSIQEDGILSFDIEIPFGCNAEVVLPEQKPKWLDAGSYHFDVRTRKNYTCPYSEKTQMERLLKDYRAEVILRDRLPTLYASLDRKDPETMGRCLMDYKRVASIFHLAPEQFDEAIAEICSLKFQQSTQ